VGLALTLAGLGEFLWLRREQPGRILDFQPIAPSRVLIARRDIHPDVPEVYLELDEAQKGVVWRRRLPHARISPDAWSVLPNVVATAGVHVVRTVRNEGEDRAASRPWSLATRAAESTTHLGARREERGAEDHRGGLGHVVSAAARLPGVGREPAIERGAGETFPRSERGETPPPRRPTRPEHLKRWWGAAVRIWIFPAGHGRTTLDRCEPPR